MHWWLVTIHEASTMNKTKLFIVTIKRSKNGYLIPFMIHWRMNKWVGFWFPISHFPFTKCSRLSAGARLQVRRNQAIVNKIAKRTLTFRNSVLIFEFNGIKITKWPNSLVKSFVFKILINFFVMLLLRIFWQDATLCQNAIFPLDEI